MTAHLTTAHTAADEREAAIVWLRIKIIGGTAGLDPHDPTVMIVEVNEPEQAWRLNLIGEVLGDDHHVRPDLSTCFRVRAILQADVREQLRLDTLGAPVLADTPLASRSAESHQEARAQIVEIDRSRRAGRSYRR